MRALPPVDFAAAVAEVYFEKWVGRAAAATMVGASVVFGWFVGRFANYSLVYGSLASVVVLLVWLYLCGNILILGSVVNHVRERGRGR